MLPTVRGIWNLPGLLAVLLAGAALQAQTPADRGRYLVEEVGKCGMCHTPVVDGKADRSKHLKGAVLPVQPIGDIKGWHKTAPDLTPGSRLWLKWGEKGLVAFMVSGKNPAGHEADPPMPTYNLKPEDAEAVVEYLKSLK